MIKKYFEKNRKLIDKKLEFFLPKRSIHPRIIHEAMRYSVLNGGKRIRPMLVLESSRICGGKTKNALPIACAIELVHSYSLIHDDLPSMDDADIRRGKPSCHVKYGEALAILAGDSLLTLAFNLISRGKDKSKTGRIIFEISKAIGSFGMIGGQVMDLKVKDEKIVDLPTMEYINIHKTASLIAASAKAGALMANAPDKKVEALQKYGEFIGLAFQVIDDILDKDGYVGIFGLSGAREEAQKLAERAKDLLKIFGSKADNLRELADFVVNRKE
ncbi:MAG: polyprenyl synthetase family protein [Candidatus Omnitrophica bacterium]|nr:polyprenyl synthetase family protein [Candidatus Omnitrophota bacterium]